MGSKKTSDPGAGQREAALAMGEKAAQQYTGLTPPDIAAMELELEAPELVGILTPEEYAATKFADISVDPRLRAAQMSALSALQLRGEQGYTPEDQALLEQARLSAVQTGEAQRQRAMQEQAERGLSSSGQGFLASLVGGQNAANQQAMQALNIAAQSNQAKMAALQQAGAMSGQMEERQYGQEAQKAAAQDAINAMNTKTRMDVQAQNLASRQRVADAAVGIRNQQQEYNKQLAQTDFANRYQIAAGKAGAYGGQANMLAQMGNLPTTTKPGPGGAIIGGALSGAATGAAIPGAGVYGALGGAAAGGMLGGVGSMFSADGGIIRGHDIPDTKSNSTNNYSGSFADGGQVYNGEPSSEQSTEDVRNLVKKETHFSEGGQVSKEIQHFAPPKNSILARVNKKSGLNHEQDAEQLTDAATEDYSGSFDDGGMPFGQPQYANGGTLPKLKQFSEPKLQYTSENRLSRFLRLANGGNVDSQPAIQNANALHEDDVPQMQGGAIATKFLGSSGNYGTNFNNGGVPDSEPKIMGQNYNCGGTVEKYGVGTPHAGMTSKNDVYNQLAIRRAAGNPEVQAMLARQEEKRNQLGLPGTNEPITSGGEKLVPNPMFQGNFADKLSLSSPTETNPIEGKSLIDSSSLQIAPRSSEDLSVNTSDLKNPNGGADLSKLIGGVSSLAKGFGKGSDEEIMKRPAWRDVSFAPDKFTIAKLPQLAEGGIAEEGTLEITPEMAAVLKKRFGNYESVPYIKDNDREFLNQMRQGAGPVKFYDRNHEQFIEKKDGKLFAQDPRTGEVREITMEERGPVKFTQDQLKSALRAADKPAFNELQDRESEQSYRQWAERQPMPNPRKEAIHNLIGQMRPKSLYAEGGIAEDKVGQFANKLTDGNNFLDSGFVSNYNEIYEGFSPAEKKYVESGLDFDVEKSGFSKDVAPGFEDGGTAKKKLTPQDTITSRLSTAQRDLAKLQKYSDNPTIQLQIVAKEKEVADLLAEKNKLDSATEKAGTILGAQEQKKLTDVGVTKQEMPKVARKELVNVNTGSELPISNKAVEIAPTKTGNAIEDARELARGMSEADEVAERTARNTAIVNASKKGIKGLAALGLMGRALGGPEAFAAQELLGAEDVGAGSDVVSGPDFNAQQRLARQAPAPEIMPTLKDYDAGGIQDGHSFVGDKVDAKINSGEMVTNLAQQQKTKEAINGEHDKPYVGNRVDEQVNKGNVVLNTDAQNQLFNFLSGKTKTPPKEDIVEPADEKKNARLKAIEAMRK